MAHSVGISKTSSDCPVANLYFRPLGRLSEFVKSGIFFSVYNLSPAADQSDHNEA